MTPALLPSDIAFRLGVTLLASSLFGLDRGFKGHPAGLRTMVLVGLAAALAMISGDLLLGTAGKTGQSFATMDVMRLPLGILTGVGFIGGGAILRRGGLVTGLTTAATLWIVTVVGLCFGAGQIGLGLGGTALGTLTVWGLKRVEAFLPRERHGELVLETARHVGPSEVERRLAEAGLQASLLRLTAGADGETRVLAFELRWIASPRRGAPIEAIERIGLTYAIRRFSVPSTMAD